MNKKILSKLKMEKPKYYDLTENRVAIIQEHILNKKLQKSYWRGFQLGSLPGFFGLAISLLFMLVTAQGFDDFLGVEGSAWKAIFILLLITSSLIFFILLIINLPNFWKRIFRKSKSTDEFFDEDRRI